MLDWTAGLGPVVFRRAGISVWAVAWKADIAGRKGKLQRLQKNSLRVGVAFFGDVHHGSSDWAERRRQRSPYLISEYCQGDILVKWNPEWLWPLYQILVCEFQCSNWIHGLCYIFSKESITVIFFSLQHKSKFVSVCWVCQASFVCFINKQNNRTSVVTVHMHILQTHRCGCKYSFIILAVCYCSRAHTHKHTHTHTHKSRPLLLMFLHAE